MQPSASHQVFKSLKLSSRQESLPNALESPRNLTVNKPRYKSLFEKIDLTRKTCENIQKEVQKTIKKYSKRIENNLKNLSNLSEEEDLNPSWREQFQEYKENKLKRNRVLNKFKGISHNEYNEKEPIRRMNLKDVLNVAKDSRISVSEIYSSAVKLALMKNKRKFGEIRVGNKESTEKLNEKTSRSGVNAKLKMNSADMQSHVLSKGQKDENKVRLVKKKESKIYERAKKLPKLANQIKDFKYRSYD